MNQLLAGYAKEVFVVIPAHNEERFIGSVVLTALEYVNHVVVIDDGSSDRTVEVARSAGADVISLAIQGGKGKALNAGFEYLRQISAEVAVTIDGDAQHDARDIPRVVEPILAGSADIVIGSRFLTVRSDIPAWRKVGQWGLTLTTNLLSGAHVTDSQSGYRAFSSKALELLRFRTEGLSVESEMQFLIDDYHLRIAEVPIQVQYLDGNKRNPVTHGIQVIDSMMAIVARRHPLLLIATPGVILIILGCVSGVESLSQVYSRGIHLSLLFVTTLSMVGGILLLLTGTILHSLEFVTTRLSKLILDELPSESVKHLKPTRKDTAS